MRKATGKYRPTDVSQVSLGCRCCYSRLDVDSVSHWISRTELGTALFWAVSVLSGVWCM